MTAAIVTATTSPARARACLLSWKVPPDVPLIIVLNTPQAPADGIPEILGEIQATYLAKSQYLGTVPAFRAGVDFALDHTEAEIIFCLHDDLEMLDPDWIGKTVRHFERTPACGLAGYGGAIGLGSDQIYKTPYDPMQLARIGFRSNLVDAEVHGLRSLLSERVACLDGFSQIGRRAFWIGQGLAPNLANARNLNAYGGLRQWERPLTYLEDHGFVHHFQDGALGCLAARYGWETWYLPVRARHLGGQTAVGDRGYQAWAQTQILQGDQGFWQQSHARGYELFTDVLPLRV